MVSKTESDVTCTSRNLLTDVWFQAITEFPNLVTPNNCFGGPQVDYPDTTMQEWQNMRRLAQAHWTQFDSSEVLEWSCAFGGDLEHQSEHHPSWKQVGSGTDNHSIVAEFVST